MKLTLSLLFIIFTAQVYAQNYPVTGITISLPANPDASIANWKSGTSMLTITAMAKAVTGGRVDPSLESARILMFIKKSGGKICGSYTSQSAPAAGFNSLNKVWSGSNAVSLFGQECTLPPGDYDLCVQIFGNGPAGPVAQSEEKCKTFTIRGVEPQSYQPPQPLMPASGTSFSEADAAKPISFRWTPVIPKPTAEVTYRLRVWQLMPGQNATQAMATNTPVIIKEVNNFTQTTVQILKPPPDQLDEEFIWNIQALDKSGKAMGSNNGTGEFFPFTRMHKPLVITKELDKSSPMIAFTPGNGETIPEGKRPEFSWKLPENSKPFPPDTRYKLVIKEILLNQSPYEGMRTNKPHFEKDSLRPLSFEYPSYAPALKEGKRYAWMVQAKDGRGVKITESEINEFVIATGSAGLTLVSPSNGSTILQPEQLNFQWRSLIQANRGGFYKIKIVEIKGDQSPEDAIRTNKPHFEKDSIKLLSFLYPETAPELNENKTYAWGIFYGDKKSEVWRFIIPRRRIDCRDLKFNFVRNTKEDKNGCCFDISISNRYNGADKPVAVRLRSTNTITSISGLPESWEKPSAKALPAQALILKPSEGVLSRGSIRLGRICFREVKPGPFYVVYEWLNKDGKIICRDSVNLNCSKEATACCKYALYVANSQSAVLFSAIKLSPVGTTKITDASSDEDFWVQNSSVNYTSVTYTALTGPIPLILEEEENIYFSIDPSSSATPQVKVEWIDNTGTAVATHVITLPCLDEKAIEDERIDWDSYTKIISGAQYNIFSGIEQIPCSQLMYKSQEACPEIMYTLSCNATNETVLKITRSNSDNPFFEWKEGNTSKGNAEEIIISPATGNRYEIELVQSVMLKKTDGTDSVLVEDCTSEKTIKINHPNPNFINLQIGQPCPDFIIKFIYTDGLLDVFQPSDWTYSWTFKLDSVVKGTSTDQNPTMTFHDPGTYTVTIEVTTGWGCKYSYTSQIELSRACNAKLDWGYTWCKDSTIMPNQSYTTNVTFQNLSTGGTCPTFEIDFGSGFIPFTNGMVRAFTGIPGATFSVKFRMMDNESGTPVQCDQVVNTLKIAPLEVSFKYTTCPNGDVIVNTGSPNPKWEFPGATQGVAWEILNKHKNTATPNYNPGEHAIYLTCTDTNTHASCRIGKSFQTIDICCDEQKSLQPFTRVINGHNYKMRGKFKISYHNNISFNRHTKVITKTLAFKEKTKKNGKKRWKRLKPEQIYAGVDGIFYTKGSECDCDLVTPYTNGDGSWDWWIRGVRFRQKLYNYYNGLHYIRWNSVKSVHRIRVEGVDWEEYIKLGQEDCTQ